MEDIFFCEKCSIKYDIVTDVKEQYGGKEIITMSESSFFKVERRRLYYTIDSLPEDAKGRDLLGHAMNIGIALVQQIDNWTVRRLMNK